MPGALQVVKHVGERLAHAVLSATWLKLVYGLDRFHLNLGAKTPVQNARRLHVLCYVQFNLAYSSQRPCTPTR